MLILQSLAYALPAGLPPEAGLYANMTPLLAYAVCSEAAECWRSGRWPSSR